MMLPWERDYVIKIVFCFRGMLIMLERGREFMLTKHNTLFCYHAFISRSMLMMLKERIGYHFLMEHNNLHLIATFLSTKDGRRNIHVEETISHMSIFGSVVALIWIWPSKALQLLWLGWFLATCLWRTSSLSHSLSCPLHDSPKMSLPNWCILMPMLSWCGYMVHNGVISIAWLPPLPYHIFGMSCSPIPPWVPSILSHVLTMCTSSYLGQSLFSFPWNA